MKKNLTRTDVFYYSRRRGIGSSLAKRNPAVQKNTAGRDQRLLYCRDFRLGQHQNRCNTIPKVIWDSSAGHRCPGVVLPSPESQIAL